jgi:NAD(P)-dependent dehydrogenase (short-subunit alcohol dehydrogenase family)
MGEIALIVGVGPGLSASMARRCASEGMQVAVAARSVEKLAGLAEETGARVYACDVSDPGSVESLFSSLDADLGTPDLVMFNPSMRVPGPVAELDPDSVRQALLISCYGGFLVGRAAAERMVPRGSGTILLTGATASVKGYPTSAAFAMGKFGLRGLAQSMARELAPKGIHVAHFVVDGIIARKDGSGGRGQREDESLLDPDAIADTYWHVHKQHRSSWTWEVEVRPWTEKF